MQDSTKEPLPAYAAGRGLCVILQSLPVFHRKQGHVILKINDSELDIVSDLYQISGTVSDRCHKLIRNHNLHILILTCGENGSYVFSSDGTHSFITTPKVNVADTVGAGDSFTAAFTAATLRGASIAEAHQVAVNISAYVCTQQGATPRLPKEFKLNI